MGNLPSDASRVAADRSRSGLAFGAVLLAATLIGCGSANTDTRRPPTYPQLQPRPLLTPDEYLRRHTELQLAHAKKELCDKSKLPAYQQLTTKLSELTRATDPATRLKKLQEVKGELDDEGKRSLGESEDLSKVRQAALDQLTRWRQAIDADSSLKRAAKATIGGECDAICLDAVVQKCGAEGITPTRSSDALGPSAMPGLSWQTSVAEGLGAFLQRRATSETTLWLLSEFQDDLCGAEAKGLFPETCLLALKLPRGSPAISGSLAASALRADLEALPLRLLRAQKVPVGPAALDSFLQLFDRVRSGTSPLGLLAAFGSSKALADECTTGGQNAAVACDLRKVGSILGLLGKTAKVDRDQLEPALVALANDFAEAFKVLKSNEKICKDKNPPGFCDFPPELDRDAVQQLVRLVNRLHDRLGQLQAKELGEKERIIASAEILGLTIDIIDAALVATRDKDKDKDKEAPETGWADVRAMLDASAELYRGRYADGTRRLLGIAQRKLTTCEGNAEVDSAGIPKCVPPAVYRHVPLIVDVAAAERPEDVEAALDAATAPVGSWRIKRTKPTASVTALVGGAFGSEKPVNGEGRESHKAAGAVAALGVDFTVPTWNIGAIGVMVSLVDVGQLLTTPIDAKTYNTRAGGTSVASGGADIELVQILSPGAYLHWSVADTPFVLGGGVSVAPRIRKYESVSGSGERSDDNFTMLRVMGVAAVDVTLFPF